MHGPGYQPPSREEQRAKLEAALASAASRNLPVPYDGQSVAAMLLDDSTNGDALAVSAMESGIYRNAQNPRGISERELESRKAFPSVRPGSVGDYWLNQPGYELGKGDEENYRALRDSNLLNAVVGRAPVPSFDDLAKGATYGDGDPLKPSWNPVNLLFDEETNRRTAHDNYKEVALSQWQQGENDPSRWANLLEANYPQHSAWGAGVPAIQNVQKNNGGSMWHDSLAWMGRWDEGGNRAMTLPSKKYDPMTERGWDDEAAGFARWVGGAWQGAEEEKRHRQAAGLVNRASPLLPGDTEPGSADGNRTIAILQRLRDATERPSIEAHAAARGEPKLDTATRLWRNNRFIAFDPMTAASAAFSGGAALLGKGALKAAGAALGREALSEGLSPFNGMSILSGIVNPYPTDLPNAQEFQAQRDAAESAFKKIPGVVGQYRTYGK